MFGFIGRRRARLDRIEAVLELSTEFLNLQNEAPAAAWFFAKTLQNSLPLLTADWSYEEKLAFIENKLLPDALSAANVDGGMATFATRFLKASVQAIHKGEYEFSFSVAISRIAEGAAKHIEIRQEHRRWPKDKQQQEFLRQQNSGSLDELISRLVSDFPENLDPELLVMNVHTITAAFEIKIEASSGILWRHVKKIDEICSRLSH